MSRSPLSNHPWFRLDTLRVDVASRTASGFPARLRVVQVLTEEDLRELPVRTVAEALQWMTAADLQPRSPAQTDLSLRGSTFEQVLVLVDGVRMSDPQTGHFDLDLAVPLDRVARIEVLEGPASALYGADALGGVVNVVTREGGTRASGWSERGAFDTWRAGASLDGELGRCTGWRQRRVDPVRWAPRWHRLRGAPVPRPGVPPRPQGGGWCYRPGRAVRDFGANGFYVPRDSYEETRTTAVSAGWSGDVGGGFTLHPLLTMRRHGDPDLKAERSWSAEVGVDLGLPRTSVVRVTGFHRQSDELIDWVKPANSPAATPSMVENVESATYRGLELSLEGLVLEGFRIEAGGSLLSLTADEAAGLTSRYALRPLVRARARGREPLAPRQ